MKVCRICLERDTKLHDIELCGLKAPFEALTNSLLSQDGFPEQVCWECRARLFACARLREKALRSQTLLAATHHNARQLEYIDREKHALTSCLKPATLVDHYDVHVCWSVKEEPEDMHEVKLEIELEVGLELMQPDLSYYETPQLNKPAETLHESRDDEKVKVHAIVEDDTSHTKIDESVNHNMKTIVNLTHGNMHNQDIGTKNPNSDKIVYIKPDPEELPTQTAASKTDSQHVMALQIADRSFKCCRCDHVCNRKRSLLRHLMVHSGERPFMCSCGSKYIQKKHLERHIQQNGCQSALTQEHVQHLENQQYTVARTVQSSAEHVKTNLVAFECDECGKGYHLKSELRKHILTHMLLEESLNVSGHTFSCTVCHNTFATKVVLSDHVKSQHPAHFETVQKCRLLLRQQKHTGEKPYKCDSCDYKSARKANLKQHVMCKHVNKKPFKCRHCESRFNLETNLRAHELVHTGEKPYKCRYCSFTSGHYSSVCAHQKLHSGDKPHKCGLCNYRAARKQNIKIHVMNVHTREKPFKCDRCDYACRLKSQMKEHVVVHTSEKPYKCEVCNYACKRIAQLKRHVKRHKSGVNC